MKRMATSDNFLRVLIWIFVVTGISFTGCVDVYIRTVWCTAVWW